MKFRILNIVTLTFLGVLPIGCDRLPEAFSGKASSDAKPIHAAGPNRQAAADHASVTPGNPLPVDDLVSDPKFKTIDSATTSDLNDSRIQLVHSQTTVPNEPESIEPPPATNISNPLPSATTSPGQNDGIIFLDYATLKFVDDIEVAAPSDGIITRLDFKAGDSVGKDEVLLELDNRLVQAELEVARNESAAAIEKSRDTSDIEYAKSSEEVAKQDLESSRDLLERKVETKGDYRKKWLEHVRAGCSITVAELKHNQDIAAAHVSRAKEKKAEIQLQLLSVKSYFNGIIANKEKDINEWVRAGDVVLRVVSLEKLRVVGHVPINALEAPPHLLVNAPAKATIQLYPNATQEVMGTVGFVSPAMDSSGRYEIWVEIDNQKVRDQWLFREGMISTIEIDAQARQ